MAMRFARLVCFISNSLDHAWAVYGNKVEALIVSQGIPAFHGCWDTFLSILWVYFMPVRDGPKTSFYKSTYRGHDGISRFCMAHESNSGRTKVWVLTDLSIIIENVGFYRIEMGKDRTYYVKDLTGKYPQGFDYFYDHTKVFDLMNEYEDGLGLPRGMFNDSTGFSRCALQIAEKLRCAGYFD